MRKLSAGMLGVGLLLLSAAAHASDNDVSLLGVGRPASNSLKDPANARYVALTSELALSMTPHATQSAETTGLSGFDVALSVTGTAISSKASFWQGQPGWPVLDAGLHGGEVPRLLWTPSLRVRKGLGFNTELAFAGTLMPDSHISMLSGEIKVGLHESLWRWVPSLSVRAGAHRLIGGRDFALLAIEAGALASLRVPIAGVGQVVPYVGFSELMVQVNPDTLDSTPYSVTDPIYDQIGGPQGSLYNLPALAWYQNRMQRYYGGVHVDIAMLTGLYELAVNSYGSTTLLSHSFKLGFNI